MTLQASPNWYADIKRLMDQGLKVLPLQRGRKNPNEPWVKFRTIKPTEGELDQWAANNLNLGIITGTESGIIVLDLDSSKALEEANQRGLPRTVSVRTPRGMHVYFRHPGADIRNKVHLFDGADLRADGGFVVAPGSVFVPDQRERGEGKVSGRYEWENSPDDAPFADAPAWLLDLICAAVPTNRKTKQPIQRRGSRDLDTVFESLSQAEPGERNSQLNLAAFQSALNCAAGLGSEEEAKEQLHSIALRLGLSSREAETTIKSGWTAGIQKAPIEATEDGLALAFTRRFGADYRFDPNEGFWAKWDGARWSRGVESEVLGCLRKLGRETDGKALRSNRALRGAEALLRGDPEHRMAQPWDADPYLMGTQTGVIDLRSGQFQPSARENFVLRSTELDPVKRLPWRWLRFLLESTRHDKQVVRFLQRFMGYALTGDTKEQIVLFIYGDGGNGKSVFLETLQRCLGRYACAANIDAFTVTSNDRHPTELARLRGMRLVSCSETRASSRWDEQRLKELTGGDKISARFMRQDFFEYRPQFKLVFVGNHKPRIANVDNAIRRRIVLVPFTQKPKRIDPDLSKKLRNEAGAILHWAIQGCLEWQRNGLSPPPTIVSETESYFEAEDHLGNWISSACVIGRDKRATPTELHSSWTSYATQNEVPTNGIAQFGSALEMRGFGRTKANGVRYHIGLALKTSQGQEGQQ